jgi:replication initiator protein
MAAVHQLIERKGVERARQLALSGLDRLCVEAAAQFMGDEEQRLGISHAGFAMTSLPHKRIADTIWRREGHSVTLIVQSGTNEAGEPIGVPYGSTARLILVYLQTEAIRTDSPEVKLGRSMRNWLNSMGIADGGNNYRLVTEQLRRISACSLAFISEKAGREIRHNGAFIDFSDVALNVDDRQLSLWQERIILNRYFWQSLREHPVPIQEAALRAIGGRSMAIDVYVWLAYRLRALSKPTPVGWSALYGQFGAGFRQVRQFRAKFRESLQVACAVYPEADVSLGRDGVVLNPSRSPVEALERGRWRSRDLLADATT